jgi:predicted enzyme related to lactoylglutathione lyase
MGEVTTYPHGTFCWIDLGTTDLEVAKTFYGEVLGWEMEDVPAGPSETYTMCRLGGKDVAGMHRHSAEEGSGWSSYVSVDDVDVATANAVELGAKLVMGPFEIGDEARAAILQDPTGAEVALWQPNTYAGARLVNEVGTWSWNELVTTDVDGATAFYGALFGWKADRVPGPITRASLSLDDLLIGGVHTPTPPEGDTPRWTVSFSVADADESVARAERLGGRTVLPTMDIPIGRFAILTDSAGAEFTVAAVPGGPLRGADGS